MSVYFVNWNLNKEKGSAGYSKARADLLSKLASFDRISDQGLESSMFIDAPNWNARDVSDHLRSVMDDNDRLMVVILQYPGSNYSGWLDSNVVNWLNKRVY